MAPFDIREVRELMEDDELELDTIGDEKTALFLIMSDTDTTFNFILAMVQSQLIIGGFEKSRPPLSFARRRIGGPRREPPC